MIAALALLVMSVPPTLPIPDGYVPIIDGTQSIVVAVPEGWGEVRVEPLILEDGSEAPYIVASPNVMRFYTTFEVPGMDYAALPYEADPLVYLALFGLTTGCETIQVKEYDDPDFVGVIQIGTHCGSKDMLWNMVVASPHDHSYTAMVRVQAVDPNRVRTVLLTFNTAD